MWMYRDILSSQYLENWQLDQAEQGASFQQSASWACFQEQLGQEVFCLSGNGWSALCIERRTLGGKYWFIPAGPTVSVQSQVASMFATLASEARARGVLWIRFEPRGIENLEAIPHIIPSPLEINPVRTQLISLDGDLDRLWQGVAPKHRSDIKHFESMGGMCRISTHPADLDTFIEFYLRLGRSKSRVFRDEGYLRAQFDLPAHLRPQLYCAYNAAGRMVSGCVIYNFAGVSSYVYAASCEDIREYRGACHALVWCAIKQAAEDGNKTFDLFGVCDLEDTRHPWYGLTKFKSKFGGEVVRYAHPYDLPLKKRYYVVRSLGYWRQGLAARLRDLKRVRVRLTIAMQTQRTS